jgi:hypothetical protein
MTGIGRRRTPKRTSSHHGKAEALRGTDTGRDAEEMCEDAEEGTVASITNTDDELLTDEKDEMEISFRQRDEQPSPS